MAVSGQFSFNLNRNQIIEAALRRIGVLGAEETSDAAMISYGQQRLNLMLKSWGGQKLGIWVISEATLFLELNEDQYVIGSSSGDHLTTSYTETALAADAASGATTITVDSITGIADTYYIGVVLDSGALDWTTVNGTPSGSSITLTSGLDGAASEDNAVYAYSSKVTKVLDVVDARYVNSSNERPLDIISRGEYMAMTPKTTTGEAVSIYYQPRISDGLLYVWPVADSTTDKIKLSVKTEFDDIASQSNNVRFPVEWLDCIIDNLAVELLPEYKTNFNHAHQMIIAGAQDKLKKMKRHDSPKVPIRFCPSVQ